MSLFKKSKKNIRRRNIDSDDDDMRNDDPMETDFVSNGVKKTKEKVKSSTTKSTLLSFADDEEENGEVFQVKKSSYSKKYNREKRKKRNKAEEEEQALKDPPNELRVESDDLVLVVKTKEEEEARGQQNLILNGRAALLAGKNDASSSDEDQGSTRFKFSQSNRSEIMIESGQIPDAATIHAARKRRQRARLLNVDTIPLESSTLKSQSKSAKSSSRLVREEDEVSDEERVSMGTGLEPNDLNARRADYYDTLEQGPETEVEPVQQGSWVEATPSCQLLPPPPPSAICTNELASPSILTQRLRDRLAMLKEVHSRHCAEIVRAEMDFKENVGETKKMEVDAPDLAAKFRFYQDMRGYVTDLVECLDEKVPGLVKLEETVRKLWADRSNYFSGRRRLDVRDQADEMSHLPKNNSVPRWSKEEEEARGRRAAEREGRRTRRRRVRELRNVSAPHVDGMSSDDEETELESSTFLGKLEEIRHLGAGLLDDVEDEFGSVSGVASRMEKWRKFDIMAYQEAYASLCLPKLLGPLARFQLLTWNPLQAESIELDSTTWWGRLLTFGLEEDETMASLAKDPDLLLLPVIVEKVIVPNVTELVNIYWDPLSSSQTLRLVNFINKYVAEMPGVTPKSAQLERLLEAVLAKLKHAVDNDVFIPITFVGGEAKAAGSVFFQRQFASAVKLLRNALSFQGLLAVDPLHEVALDSLLNRYLLAAIRVCQPCDAISKANMVISTFPRWWFQTETKIPKLEMLTRHLKQLSQQVQPHDTLEKDSYELVNNLMKTLQLSCPTAI